MITRSMLLAGLLSSGLVGCAPTPKPTPACDLIDRPRLEEIVGRKIETIELINEETSEERVGSTCEVKFVNRPNMRFWVYEYRASTQEIEARQPQARKVDLVRGHGYFADNVVGKDNMIDAYFDDKRYVAIGITFYNGISDTKRVLVDSADMIIGKTPP